MTPTDVPTELVRAALAVRCTHCSLTVGREPISAHEQEVRAILAAVLPLHSEWLAGHFDDISASRARASQQTEGWSQAMAHIQADAYHTAAWLIRNPDQFRASEQDADEPAKTTQQLARRYGSAADAQNTNTEK